MAQTRLSKKRKAGVVDAAPPLDDDELAGVVLDGVLSASEGEEDGEYDLEEDADEDDEGEDEDDEDDEDEDDEDDEDEVEDDKDEDDEDDEEDDKNENEDNKTTLTHRSKIPSDNDADIPNYRTVTDANGGVRYEYNEIDPVYDSDDTDAQSVAGANTIGNIPLSFYDSYPHIGYDINGKRIMRPAAGDALDALLDSIEVPAGWTGLTDPATGKPLELSRDELELLRRLQMNEVPEDGFDPYPETIEYFTSIQETMPLSSAPEPKRRFVPSAHEAKRVIKMVRAIREGRILPYKPPKDREHDDDQDDSYSADNYVDLWADEQPREPHAMHMPAPKLPPPGYDLSYNPPAEYLPTPAERDSWEAADPEDREKAYLPAKYDALRKVPAYAAFVKERFERCLDLYLAPRVRRTKLNIDPTSLLPKLPRPEDLRPFPTTCQTVFCGHQGRVRSVSVSPDGLWLASGGDDGTVRVWALNGHQEWMAKLSGSGGEDEPVSAVRWRPTRETCILAAAIGEDVFLMVPTVAGDVVESASRAVLDAGFGYHAVASSSSASSSAAIAAAARKDPAGKWARPGARLEDQGVLLRVTVRSAVKVISWHRRGDFFATTSPRGQRSSIAVHTLSRHLTQIPFRRLPGLAQAAHFHPSRPIFFVATQRAVRVYDLQRQELVKVLQPGARWISSFDVHPGGDNVVVASYDRRLVWHDLDLSTRPYRTMRFHPEAVRAVRFHRGGLPLFADASDDGSLQVFHAKVVADLTENATIVPVKMLRGHQVVGKLGVMDVDWHPRHPWLVSAGADGTCRLWT